MDQAALQSPGPDKIRQLTDCVEQIGLIPVDCFDQQPLPFGADVLAQFADLPGQELVEARVRFRGLPFDPANVKADSN